MMEGVVCPVTAAVAVVGIAGAAMAARTAETKPSPGRFAAVTALVFAAQMMNFPIQPGTSGHLVGGVLASILLGTPFGILSVALVVAVQCFLFADGGLTVLGANILNMAMIGAGFGGWLASRLRAGKSGWANAGAIAAASWASVMAAALAVSSELALAGTVSFFTVALPMLGLHALIGLGEAAITLAVLSLVPERSASDFRRILVPFALAVFVAAVFSQFASGHPDALERAALDLGFFREPLAGFFGPMADYEIPGVVNATAAAGLAGLAGVIAVAVVAILVARVWEQTPRRA